MSEFHTLLDVTDRLLGPQGCAWDQAQTMMTIRSTILEEVYEVIEAIDLGNNDAIRDELGDLFFNVIFLCRLAEKESRFTLDDVLSSLVDKLIRRHPHIFGDISGLNTADAVVNQWEKIKQSELAHSNRTSLLDGIPRDLPSLARAQKMLKKIGKTSFERSLKEEINPELDIEDAIGKAFLKLVAFSNTAEIDPEQALRKTLVSLNEQFREWENKNPLAGG